jgi:hypothetical protein
MHKIIVVISLIIFGIDYVQSNMGRDCCDQATVVCPCTTQPLCNCYIDNIPCVCPSCPHCTQKSLTPVK